MAVFYQLYQNKRTGSTTKDKWYARAKVIGTKDLRDIAEIIQRNASVKRSDVMAVLTELPEVMGDMLLASYRVKLNGFGAFKIGICTRPANTMKEFTVDANIAGSRIVFQPETERQGSNGPRVRTLATKVEYQSVEKLNKKKE